MQAFEYLSSMARASYEIHYHLIKVTEQNPRTTFDCKKAS